LLAETGVNVDYRDLSYILNSSKIPFNNKKRLIDTDLDFKLMSDDLADAILDLALEGKQVLDGNIVKAIMRTNDKVKFMESVTLFGNILTQPQMASALSNHDEFKDITKAYKGMFFPYSNDYKRFFASLRRSGIVTSAIKEKGKLKVIAGPLHG